jgi:hypothetical protein
MTYPMTVPPPFATSLGSDERLPRPQRGAPPVAPAKTAEERKQQQHNGVAHTLRRAIGLERTRLDPALCEGWWYVSVLSWALRMLIVCSRFRNPLIFEKGPSLIILLTLLFILTSPMYYTELFLSFKYCASFLL